MPDTDFATLAYDFAIASKVASLLRNEGVPAVAEEYEIGMAHIRLDPEEHDPTGYITVASDTAEDGNPEGGWVMIQTYYDEHLHTYETPENPILDPLGVPVDADPEEVADAIVNFLS